MFTCCTQPVVEEATEPRGALGTAWWANHVTFSVMEETPWGTNTEKTRYHCRRVDGRPYFVRISQQKLTGPPTECMEKMLAGNITSFTEYRVPILPWLAQLTGLPLYHTYAVMEVNKGDFQILFERVGKNLEMMIGAGHICRKLMKGFNVQGGARDVSTITANTRHVNRTVSVKDMLAWIGTSLAARWEPYALLSNNCQHFLSELQVLLFDKSGALEARQSEGFNRALAVESLRQDGLRLKYLPRRYRDDIHLVFEAVQQNGTALKYATKKMRENPNIVLAAGDQTAEALQYAVPSVLRDRTVMKTLMEVNGKALQYLPDELRRDRGIYLPALRQASEAAQYVPPDLRNWEVSWLVASHKLGIA